LDNKSVVYTRRQARTLGLRKKDFAQAFGVHDEWVRSLLATVFQLLHKFAKSCNEEVISEGEALYILQDFATDLKSQVMMVMPIRRERNSGEVARHLELMNWMIRRHVEKASEATLVETLNFAVQRDDADVQSFAERLRRLNTECRFMYGKGALKGRFVEGVHRAAGDTARNRNTPGMTMEELARVAQIAGDEPRWLRHEQRKWRTKEKNALVGETRLRRQALLAASPPVSAESRAYPLQEAPVGVFGPSDAPLGVVRAVGDPTSVRCDSPCLLHRQGNDLSRPVCWTGEHFCLQCGKVGHGAEVCPIWDVRLRERSAAASRWSPLCNPLAARAAPRMGRRVPDATPKDRSSSSGETSEPLGKGKQLAGTEYGP